MGVSRYFRALCLPLALLSSGAFAVDAEDVLILQSVRAVTAGVNGNMIVNADKITLRERQNREYDYSKYSAVLTAPYPTKCGDYALAAADKGRMTIRVREGALGRGAVPVGDRLVIAGADLQACSWVK